MHDAVAVRGVERQRQVAQNRAALRAAGSRCSRRIRSASDSPCTYFMTMYTSVAGFAEGVHRHDVRMVEARRHARLAAEALARFVRRQ